MLKRFIYGLVRVKMSSWGHDMSVYVVLVNIYTVAHMLVNQSPLRLGMKYPRLGVGATNTGADPLLRVGSLGPEL